MSATAQSSVPNYRQILRPHLPEDFYKPDRRTLLWLVPHYGIIFGGMWVLSAHFTWWAAPLLTLVIGHSVMCLAVLGHEVCHGAATKTRFMRWVASTLSFGAFGLAPRVWARWHNDAHHNHTQEIEHDPDRLYILEEYLDNHNRKLVALHKLPAFMRRGAIFAFFTMWMTTLSTVMTLKYLKPKNSDAAERRKILAQWIAPNLFWLTLTVCLGWQVVVFGWLLPHLFADFLITCYIVTNHFLNPLAQNDEDDVLATTLTVTPPAIFDTLHFHFGAHVTHHLFPTAPSRHARAVEAKIAELWPDRYHSMPLWRAVSLFLQSNLIYDETGTKLVDPQHQLVRPTLGHGLKATD